MDSTSYRSDQEIPWVNAILIAMGAGILGIAIYAWAERSWMVFGCSLLIALAAALGGAMAGFIFGIPKSVTTAQTSNEMGTAAATITTQYQGNSNLEQISDWLTKILVGAGLVQLGSIRDEFNALGSRLADSGCMGTAGWVAGPAVIVAYVVTGFLLAYLWARIYMAKALMGGNGSTH